MIYVPLNSTTAIHAASHRQLSALLITDYYSCAYRRSVALLAPLTFVAPLPRSSSPGLAPLCPAAAVRLLLLRSPSLFFSRQPRASPPGFFPVPFGPASLTGTWWKWNREAGRGTPVKNRSPIGPRNSQPGPRLIDFRGNRCADPNSVWTMPAFFDASITSAR